MSRWSGFPNFGFMNTFSDMFAAPSFWTRLSCALWLALGSAEAQQPPPPASPAAPERYARFFGRVIDASTSQPLPGARLVSPAIVGATVTDSLGRFDIPDVPSGLIRFMVVATGFPRASLVLPFAPGEEMERVLALDSTLAGVAKEAAAATPLPTVTVEAEAAPPPRLRDFERRRLSGRGQYVTREQIEARRLNRLTDVVQTMRGVNVDCGGGGSGCTIRMARAPMRCLPDYWIDGRLDNQWGPVVSIRDIEGIEVYTGAADVPGEFAGRAAGCGTIVIWTKAGPARRPRGGPAGHSSLR